MSEHSAESNARCWCGGEVGNRSPGDKNGLGCLENSWHDWYVTPPGSHEIERLQGAWDEGAVYGRTSCVPDEELLDDNPYRVIPPTYDEAYKAWNKR